MCPVPVLPPVPPSPLQVFVSIGAALYSFTALTDHLPEVWGEVNQSSRMNHLKNVQLQEIWKPVSLPALLTGSGVIKGWDLQPKTKQLPKVSASWAKICLRGKSKDRSSANFWVIWSQMSLCSPECAWERTFPHWQRGGFGDLIVYLLHIYALSPSPPPPRVTSAWVTTKCCLIEKYQHPQQGSAKSSCWFLGPWLGGGRHSSWFQSHPWKKPSHKLFFMGCRSYFNFWVQFRKWVTSYRAFLQNQSQKWSHSNYCNSGWLHSDAGYVGSQVSSIWQSPIKLCWAGLGNTHCLFPSKMFSTVLIYRSSIGCLKLPWLWYKKQN